MHYDMKKPLKSFENGSLIEVEANGVTYKNTSSDKRTAIKLASKEALRSLKESAHLPKHALPSSNNAFTTPQLVFSTNSTQEMVLAGGAAAAAAPPRGSAAAAASMCRRRTTSGGASGGAAGTMLQFYTDDAPGLKISRNVVLIMTIGFIAFVAVLHVIGKLYFVCREA